jgi:nitrogen-specific signal transduction histidine kinase
MLSYFQTYYIEQCFGPGYVATNIAYVIAVVLLLNETRWDGKGVLRKGVECLLCWLGTVVYCSIYHGLLGHDWMDRSMMVLFLIFYAVFRSRYKPMTRLVRSSVFFACMVQSLTISEPVGELLENMDAGEHRWVENLTSVIVVVLMALTVLFLRRFSMERLSFFPWFPVLLVNLVPLFGVLLQWTGAPLGSPRGYNVLVASCFWLLELISYYMFYIVSREYEQNLELMAIRHKEELDEEMLKYSRDNYEEMHQIRHEMKNHLSYIRVLAEAGDYDHLMEYVRSLSGSAGELFRFVDCGNEVVNAVMNHAIKQARSHEVEVESQLVVPPELPYEETELCSLLSNLLDNAIEAAAQSGRQAPVVSVSIRPQQDYLFLRVTNPVSDQISPRRRLTLRTTKEDPKAHGYGTKIIRRIAQKYQGSVKFDIKDDLFVADVMLYLEDKRDGEAVSSHL